jgi:hypothetical protein
MNAYKEMTTPELLSSFNCGQGKTSAITKFANIANGVLTYNSLNAEVTTSWLEAFVLMNLHRDLKDSSDERQARLFKVYNEGRLSLNHSLSDDTAPKTKTPLMGHVLTANEYYNNCLKLAANFETVKSINLIVLDALNDTTATKQSLVDTLAKIQTFIINDTQEVTFNQMVEKEQNFEKVKTEVSGFAELIYLSETKIKAIVKPVNLDTVITSFTALGYVQQSVEFDSRTMSMVCVFDNETV